MLQLVIPAAEYYDESSEEFVYRKGTTLQLEHSLVSLSKWESKWNKPFLTNEDKTDEESLDYIRCMTITQNVDPQVYFELPRTSMQEVTAYMKAPMTATVITDVTKASKSKDILTAEVLYYYMVALNIPFECQKWHLNKLITLIRVCNVKNSPEKKMTRQELHAQNRDLNAKRRAEMNTKG